LSEPHLSIVIPAYNEEKRLLPSLEKVVSYVDSKPFQVEVIVVDDGSQDATAKIAEGFAKQHPFVRVQRNPHKGKAFAVRTGMLMGKGDFVLFTDVDLAVPIEQADVLLKELVRGEVQVCFGSREGVGANRIGEPWHRHMMGRVFNGLVRLLGVGNYQDTQCGFKAFTRDAAQEVFGKLKLYGEDAPELTRGAVTAFDVEALYVARKLGYRLYEIPVEWKYGEESKVNPMTDSISMFLDVCKVRLNAWRGRYD